MFYSYVTTWHILRGFNTLFYRYLISHVYCCSIHNNQKWEQSTCSSIDACIKKMWYNDTMEYYSSTKKKVIIKFTNKYMEMETIILNEVILIQESKCHIISLICRS